MIRASYKHTGLSDSIMKKRLFGFIMLAVVVTTTVSSCAVGNAYSYRPHRRSVY